MSGLITTVTSPQLVSPEKESLGRRIPKTLNSAATRLVDSLKVNSVSEKVRRGRRLVIKRRDKYGEPLADLANVYFRMAGIPIRFWAKTEHWQQWEVKCFNMLNGERFHARASGANGVCADKLRGKSLWDHLAERALTRKMTEAAGHELRRAHQLWSDEFRGPWSHGDAGTNNVIYDEKTGRARLIDFEIVHERSLPTKSRHADDLLVFLFGFDGHRAQPAMACSGVSLPQCVRERVCHFRIEASTRDADRDGLDLVGRANKFR